jgi:hypothetical protein
MRTRVVGRTYESQTGHLPSHLSQRRPIAMPACLRHITRSLGVVLVRCESKGRVEKKLTDDGETL